MHHVHSEHMEATRVHHLPWTWSYIQWTIIWVQGIETGPLNEQPLLLTTDPSFQPILHSYYQYLTVPGALPTPSLCSSNCLFSQSKVCRNVSVAFMSSHDTSYLEQTLIAVLPTHCFPCWHVSFNVQTSFSKKKKYHLEVGYFLSVHCWICDLQV